MNYGIEKTPRELMYIFGERIKHLRKEQKISRRHMADISGVPAPTLRKFEKTGIISLESFLMLVKTLRRLEEFEQLLQPNYLESKRYLFDH